SSCATSAAWIVGLSANAVSFQLSGIGTHYPERRRGESARRPSRLPDVTGPVRIHRRTGHAAGGVEGAENGDGGDLLRLGDAAERDVGEQTRAAAAGEVV